MRPPVSTTSRPDVDRLAADVQYYLQLSPRQLPSRYFYDDLGSALFEAICALPWYGVTRAEARLLARHRDDVFARAGRVSTFVELGSGSGHKLRTLLTSPARVGRATAHLIDVSPAALAAAERVLRDLDGLAVVPHEAEYEDGLELFSNAPHGTGAAMALFLGSNIGNFDRPGAESLLRSLRGSLARHDVLLLGADLVKPEADLLLAYDDPLGVTAAFNRNLLLHLNRQLGADFDPAAFAHRAIWNAAASRVEMHLVSTRRQQVSVPGADLTVDFDEGEPIWTESSYKYQPDGPGSIIELVERAGSAGGDGQAGSHPRAFEMDSQWIDREAGFALTLFQAI